MAQQAPMQSIRDLRQTFGVLSDQALELATSLRACACGADTHAEDGEGLDAMVEELLDVRQRVGGCICGPPCDGTSVDDVTNDFLKSMLTRLERQAAVLDENLEECGCAGRDEVETPQPVSSPRTLMGLPGEIRNMIWWRTLVDDLQLVRITPRPVYAGRPLSRTPFHPQQRFSIPGLNNQVWTWERAGEEAMQGGWALLHVNREVYREAEAEFWRRAMDGNVMLSFGAPQDVDDMVRTNRYFGIGAAWTFFRDRPVETLRNIRRVHLDLRMRDDRWGGACQQALVFRQSFGVSNWGDYTDRLLDLMRTDLTGLRHLSLTIGGFVPDIRQTPWLEAPPAWIPIPSFTPPQSSVHWVTRLSSINQLTRLRIRVIIPYLEVYMQQDVDRTAHFLASLRRDMLVNGNAIDGLEGIRDVVVEIPGFPERLIVEFDYSWDERAGRHVDLSHELGDVRHLHPNSDDL